MVPTQTLLAQEIVEDLKAALNQFRETAGIWPLTRPD
jgi:hypothetical protein